MKKSFQINEFLWLLILAGLTCYSYSTIKDNSYLRFIHPRMKGYIIFLSIALTIFTLHQVTQIYKDSRNERIKIGYILFIIPLFIGIAVNPKGLSPEIAKNRGLMLVDNSYNQGNTPKKTLDKESDRDTSVIEITSDNFYSMHREIYSNPDLNQGKHIIVEGFTYKSAEAAESSENQFVIGRMLISCCAADANMIGFLCSESEIGTLKINKWARVSGVLSYKESKIPVIMVEKVEYLNKPQNQYIYK